MKVYTAGIDKGMYRVVKILVVSVGKDQLGAVHKGDQKCHQLEWVRFLGGYPDQVSLECTYLLCREVPASFYSKHLNEYRIDNILLMLVLKTGV